MPQTGSSLIWQRTTGSKCISAGGWGGAGRGRSKAGSRQLVRGGFCLLIGYLSPLPLVP